MFGHIFINRLKILIREKSLIFWTLLFPLVLGTLFHFAFSNLISVENFSVIDIAIIESADNDLTFLSMMDSLSKGEDKIFNITYTDSKGALKMLENKEIAGFITTDIKLVTNDNGLNQTIIKSVIDNYLQVSSTIYNIISLNPNINVNDILTSLNMNEDYFSKNTSNTTDLTVIYFYTLIGFTCMAAAFWGNKTINEIEANLTRLGTRLSVAPINKFKVIFSSLLACLLIQFIETLIILAYLIFILGVSFGSNLPYIILVCLIGCLCGISFGALISSASKKDESFKTNILSGIILLCSFLSGMMVVQMKMIIQKSIPLLSYINPVNLITDALYSLYYYDTYTRFYSNIIYLFVFSLVMIFIAYFIMRRKKYDSI